MKRIAVLGSTGSVGRNALDVVRRLSSRLSITGIAALGNGGRLTAQAAEFHCSMVACADHDEARNMASTLPCGCKALSGPEGLVEIATSDDVDMVLCAVVGTAGLAPVLAALRAGKDVALASKEVLVMAGGIVMAEAERSGARVLPVDSEHSAIFQCLEGHPPGSASKLILTASGGPFRGWSADALAKATFDDALLHPTWNMGPKVSIDSATMMNKALEMVEAHWLFNMPAEAIDILVHPQSIVHSMVEFVDGTTLAQMSVPDMRFPIQYAMTYPEKVPGGLRPLSLGDVGRLDFELPDRSIFPSLDFAWEAIRVGGTLPAVMNAANEVAVERLKSGSINIPALWNIVESVMSKHSSIKNPSLEDIVAADAEARSLASACEAGRVVPWNDSLML